MEDWMPRKGIFDDPYLGFTDFDFDPNGAWTGEHIYWKYSIFGTIVLPE
jgi:hypothetical protein